MVELLKKEKPDVILLDVSLEGMAGFIVLKILKESPETRDIKIVMFCQIEREGDRKQAEELGVDDFIVGAATTIVETILRVRMVLGDVAHYQIPVDTTSSDLDRLVRDLGFNPNFYCRNCSLALELLLIKEGKDKKNSYNIVFVCPRCKDVYFE